MDFREPCVMAIVNITPDSFYADSRTISQEAIMQRVDKAIVEGASIIDIGGYSTRPGADEVSLEEEWSRVERGIQAARNLSQSIAISVDTFRAEIVRRCYEQFGEIIINDISGGGDHIYQLAGEYSLPYILMHMRGVPSTMQSLTQYHNIVEQVEEYFVERIDRLKSFGAESIILDPGFGFAKSLEQNYTLLKGMERIAKLGYPILSGISRKSMIYRPLDTTPAESLTGTSALNWESLRGGATILRVHDVKQACQVVKLFKLYSEN